MIVSNPNFLSFLIRDNVMIIRCPRCVCTILLNTEKRNEPRWESNSHLKAPTDIPLWHTDWSWSAIPNYEFECSCTNISSSGSSETIPFCHWATQLIYTGGIHHIRGCEQRRVCYDAIKNILASFQCCVRGTTLCGRVHRLFRTALKWRRRYIGLP